MPHHRGDQRDQHQAGPQQPQPAQPARWRWSCSRDGDRFRGRRHFVGCRRGFTIAGLANFRDQAIPLARDGDDVPAVLRGFAEGFAQQKDVLGEIRFFDVGIWPHRLHQLFF
jgi:hypothetical protein